MIEQEIENKMDCIVSLLKGILVADGIKRKEKQITISLMCLKGIREELRKWLKLKSK